MPSDGSDWVCDARAEARRREAWTRHYVAKGCTATKARDVATRKVQRSATWPA